jgi:hypothetical protein
MKTPRAIIPSTNPSLIPNWFYGHIYLIGSLETCEPVRYEYSPLNDTEWKPTYDDTETIVEVIPWWTTTWFLTTVGRSRQWFASVQPAMKVFWEDVEKAKQGRFELPASQRKPKETMCLIQPDDPPPLFPTDL